VTTSPISTPSKLAGSKLNPPAPTFTKWIFGSVGVLAVEGIGVEVTVVALVVVDRTIDGGNVTTGTMVSLCAETTERSCRKANGIACRIQDESMAKDCENEQRCGSY
jgi:hypothetical protein